MLYETNCSFSGCCHGFGYLQPNALLNIKENMHFKHCLLIHAYVTDTKMQFEEMFNTEMTHQYNQEFQLLNFICKIYLLFPWSFLTFNNMVKI